MLYAGVMSNQSVILKRLLGSRMRHERDRAGLSRGDVFATGICQSNELSKIENGRSAMTMRTIGALLALYKTDPKIARILQSRAQACRGTGWYEPEVPDHLKDFDLYVEVEGFPDVAIRAYEPNLVTGLLQTEEYIREISNRTIVKPVRKKLEDVIQLRMERQRNFWSHDSSRTLTWLTTPASLMMRVGSDEVMRRQRQHLQDMVEKHSDRLRVLVVDWQAGAHMSVGCDYMLVQIDENNLVFNDLRNSMRMTENVSEHAQFEAMFNDSARRATPYEDPDGQGYLLQR